MPVPKLHKAHNKRQIYPECVSFTALGYAKLAWIKGIGGIDKQPTHTQRVIACTTISRVLYTGRRAETIKAKKQSIS
jgi:hypothetical protein